MTVTPNALAEEAALDLSSNAWSRSGRSTDRVGRCARRSHVAPKHASEIGKATEADGSDNRYCEGELDELFTSPSAQLAC
jgi:hypothetical protein